MQKEWSHREDVTGRSWAPDVSSEWNIDNLCRRNDAAEVTGGDDAESAGVSVGVVKVEAKGN